MPSFEHVAVDSCGKQCCWTQHSDMMEAPKFHTAFHDKATILHWNSSDFNLRIISLLPCINVNSDRHKNSQTAFQTNKLGVQF